MTIPTFTAGSVLTASQMNQVAKQVVVTCSSTTRPSSPPEGMVVYESDTKKLSTYNGSAWVDTLPVTTTAVQTWTPTITQSGTVSHTATEARYVRNGCVVTAWANLAVTGSGTTNNAVTVTLPVTGSGHATNATVGSVTIAASSTVYTGVAFLATGLATVAFRVASSGGTSAFGQSPNVGLASGDNIRFQVTYTV